MSTPVISLSAHFCLEPIETPPLFLCGTGRTFFAHYLLLVEEDCITVGSGTTVLSFPFQRLFPSIS
jgi:hypothetical protein